MRPYSFQSKRNEERELIIEEKIEEKSEDEVELSKKLAKGQKVKLYYIKHFIFDFGGVMVEKTYVLKILFDIIETDLKISINRSEDPFYKKLKRKISSGQISSKEFLEEIFKRYYYPFQKKDGALPAKKVNVYYYLELWFQLYSQLTHFSTDMEEIIHRLHLAGYFVSLMSNTYDLHAKSNELNGFYEVFDRVFLSNEIGNIKPNIEQYNYLLKKLDTKPKKCVFIDDKLKNLAPARKLGFLVIKFEGIEKFKQQLTALGVGSITKETRRQIRQKYKQFKMKKKEYKRAKKVYKQAKKDAKKHKKSRKTQKIYKEKKDNYRKLKDEYKQQKTIKEEELEFKFKEDVS